MRKLAIKILSLLVAVTAVFGFVNLNTNVVKATDKDNGFWMEHGAQVRLVSASDDLTGIRFTAYMSSAKYDEIAAVAENDGKFLYVGIEIAPSGSQIRDICYSARKIGADDANATVGATNNIVSAIKFNNGNDYTFHGSITYRLADLISDLANTQKFNPYYVEGDTEGNVERFNASGFADAYLLQAVSMDLTAKAYYQVEGGEKVYVDETQTRSMLYVANSANLSGDLDVDLSGELKAEFIEKYLSTAIEYNEVYLQEDGEIVGYNKENLENVAFYINNGEKSEPIEVEINSNTGKLNVVTDVEALGVELEDQITITAITSDTITNANGDSITTKTLENLHGEYVTLAIDEASDFEVFDFSSKVGYTNKYFGPTEDKANLDAAHAGSTKVGYGIYGNYQLSFRTYMYFPRQNEPGYNASDRTAMDMRNPNDSYSEQVTSYRYHLIKETVDPERLGQWYYYPNYSMKAGKTYVSPELSEALNVVDDAETADVNERVAALTNGGFLQTKVGATAEELEGKVRFALLDYAVMEINNADGYYVLTKNIDGSQIPALAHNVDMETYTAYGSYFEYIDETYIHAEANGTHKNYATYIKPNCVAQTGAINNSGYQQYKFSQYNVFPMLKTPMYNDDYYDAHYGFSGRFNGKGYGIYNYTAPASTSKTGGLFGAISGSAIIENVAFIDCDATNEAILAHNIYQGERAVEGWNLPTFRNLYFKFKEGSVNPKGSLAYNVQKAGKMKLENVVIDGSNVTYENVASGKYASIFVGDYLNFSNASKLTVNTQFALTPDVSFITNGDQPIGVKNNSGTMRYLYAGNKLPEGLVTVKNDVSYSYNYVHVIYEDDGTTVKDNRAYVSLVSGFANNNPTFNQFDSYAEYSAYAKQKGDLNEYWSDLNGNVFYDSYFMEKYFKIVDENDEEITGEFTFDNNFDQTYTVKVLDTFKDEYFADVVLEDGSGFFKYEDGVLSFNVANGNLMSAFGEHVIAFRIAGTTLVKEFTVVCGNVDPITAYDGEGNVIEEELVFSSQSATHTVLVKNYLGNVVDVAFIDKSGLFTYADGVLALAENAFSFDILGKQDVVTFGYYENGKTFTVNVNVKIDLPEENKISAQAVYDTNPTPYTNNNAVTARFFYDVDGKTLDGTKYYIVDNGELILVGEMIDSTFNSYIDRATFANVPLGTTPGTDDSTYVWYYKFNLDQAHGGTEYKVYYNNESEQWVGLEMVVETADGIYQFTNALPVTDAINEGRDLQIINATHASGYGNRTPSTNASATGSTLTRGVFMFTGDIDASSKYFVYENSVLNAVKNSSYLCGNLFQGVFDGRGYEIKNIDLSGAEVLDMDNPPLVANTAVTSSEYTAYAFVDGTFERSIMPGNGLFGFITRDSAIMNLALTNVTANNGTIFASGATNGYYVYLEADLADPTTGKNKTYPETIAKSEFINNSFATVKVEQLFNPIYRNIYVDINENTYNFRGVFGSANGENHLGIRAHNMVVKYIPANYGLGEENGEAWAFNYASTADTSDKKVEKVNISEDLRNADFYLSGTSDRSFTQSNHRFLRRIGVLMGEYFGNTSRKAQAFTLGVREPLTVADWQGLDVADSDVIDGKIYPASTIYVISPLPMMNGRYNAAQQVYAYNYDETIVDEDGNEIVTAIPGEKGVFVIPTGISADAKSITSHVRYENYENGYYYTSDSLEYYYWDSSSQTFVVFSGTKRPAVYFLSTTPATNYVVNFNYFVSRWNRVDLTHNSHHLTVDSFATYFATDELASFRDKFSGTYWTIENYGENGGQIPVFKNKLADA